MDDEELVGFKNEDEESKPIPGGLTNINPDAPDFVKKIKVKSKGQTPVDLSISSIPENPYTISYPGHPLSPDIDAPEPESTFFKTARAEAFNLSPTAQGIHAAYEKGFFSILEPEIAKKISLMEDPLPPGWTPKTDIEKFQNVPPEYTNYLMQATGPKDQANRYQRVLEEIDQSNTLKNGSFVAKVLGGLVGIAADPMTYIPIAGWAKYAKLAPSVGMSMARSLPGSLAYGFASSAAEQMDKVNGNLHDFIVDGFVRTAFSTALFGAMGAGSYAIDKLALWNLKGFAKAEIDGIDFKLKINDKGERTGFQAVSKSGALSAKDVSFAQDLADSEFAKSGFFKIPKVGDAATTLLGMPVFGSPLIRLLNSPFKTVRGIIDRVADHSLITKNIEEGGVAPKKFATLMYQEFANLRALDAQMNALHLERNGFDLENRLATKLANVGLNIRAKSLKLLGKEIDKNDYVSKADFYDEITQAVINNQTSKHGPVNEAAGMIRKQLDETYARFREAYGLPKDWLPPKTAEAYLMRVYDTQYLNAHENEWIDVVSNWLKDSDEIITQKMQPIKDLEEQISQHILRHDELVDIPNITDQEIKSSSERLMALKARKKALEEKLQNDLRTDPNLQLHVEDWNALSADEAKEISTHTKRRDIAQKEVDDLKKQISDIKKQAQKREAGVQKAKTVKTAKGGKRKAAIGEELATQLEVRLSEVERELQEEQEKLQEMMHSGQINSRLFRKQKDSFIYEFKNPNERLRFRDVYGSHAERKTHAKNYYDKIMNQTAEDTINQVMGRITGNSSESPLKERTLMLPDTLLYENKFLTNDLMSKVSNYTTYLSRRTHLKSVFNDVTIDGGFEPLMVQLNLDHEEIRAPLNERLESIKQKLSQEGLTTKEINKLEKQKEKISKSLIKKRNQFETAKKDLNHLYEKMMGIQKLSHNARKLKSAVMSITAFTSLPFVPLTMINDLGAVGLQHGLWPLIKDGIYPMITSLGGILKTKDSEAFRRTAPSIHLALQDIQMGYADRNWGMMNNPYVNLGKIVGTLEWLAHSSANFTGTNYIDNGLQRLTSSITQSELMRILHDFKAGTISTRDSLYIRKYGIDPEKWSDRMIEQFKKHGGGKTKLGGYQSQFWQWDDMEAANEFSHAIFRTVKDTQISAGLLDAPMWQDDNGPIGVMGTIVRGFNGWTYASLNRYVVPSLQAPDAQKLMGVSLMLGLGAMVDPMRRMARGEEPFPENQTTGQEIWSAINNSGYFSWFANVLADVNLMTGDRLLGDLKNDKYRDRTMAGLLGPTWGKANQMKDIISALATGEMNQADAKKMARMIPFANASWTYWMSKKVVDSLGAHFNLPETRAQAHALKE